MGNDAQVAEGGTHTTPYRQVRACYTDETIDVYQAFSPAIADEAVAAGTLVPPFRLDRMTWIKPSFLWMMYRSGWATKPGQERVLRVRLTRVGFEWALARGCLSHFEAGAYSNEAAWRAQLAASPVRIQWDPERNLMLESVEHRSLQVGLCGEAVRKYVNEWIRDITDVTQDVRAVADLVARRELDGAHQLLPAERPYPLPGHVRTLIGASE